MKVENFCNFKAEVLMKFHFSTKHFLVQYKVILRNKAYFNSQHV